MWLAIFGLLLNITSGLFLVSLCLVLLVIRLLVCFVLVCSNKGSWSQGGVCYCCGLTSFIVFIYYVILNLVIEIGWLVVLSLHSRVVWIPSHSYFILLCECFVMICRKKK